MDITQAPEHAPMTVTAVPDVRRVPLEQLSQAPFSSLLRVVPAVGTVKPPTAAFDASL